MDPREFLNGTELGCPVAADSRFDFTTEIMVNTGRIDPKRGADALDLKLFRVGVVIPLDSDTILHGLPAGANHVNANLRCLLA